MRSKTENGLFDVAVENCFGASHRWQYVSEVLPGLDGIDFRICLHIVFNATLDKAKLLHDVQICYPDMNGFIPKPIPFGGMHLPDFMLKHCSYPAVETIHFHCLPRAELVRFLYQRCFGKYIPPNNKCELCGYEDEYVSLSPKHNKILCWHCAN